MNRERRQATTVAEVDDGLNPRPIEAQHVEVEVEAGAARRERARLLREPDRQRAAARRGDGRERRPLCDEFLGRRECPEDLLVESGDDPADRLPSGAALPDHQLPAPADVIAIEPRKIVRRICGSVADALPVRGSAVTAGTAEPSRRSLAVIHDHVVDARPRVADPRIRSPPDW